MQRKPIIERAGLAWSGGAAMTTAILSATSHAAPGTGVWRAGVAFAAVYAFQRGLVSAWNAMEAETAPVRIR